MIEFAKPVVINYIFLLVSMPNVYNIDNSTHLGTHVCTLYSTLYVYGIYVPKIKSMTFSVIWLVKLKIELSSKHRKSSR